MHIDQDCEIITFLKDLEINIKQAFFGNVKSVIREFSLEFRHYLCRGAQFINSAGIC